ncbi:hypothetical protein L6164_030051 [Bauhinia variegata]|uniref:Uncharacterized protein n=1 Tax=Bauhinia variegata TaxID=167791 RepID=A0ACB9LAK3_BAUVA|nr:hypothetical protein L6164_030051 [Bauhinia variegata]
MVRDRSVAAWDRIFEETVEQIHDLKAEDFWDKASELWKVMEELQSMGYNVISIRRRMEKCRLESIILCLKGRIEREEENKVQVLNEVDNMEKELANYDGITMHANGKEGNAS